MPNTEVSCGHDECAERVDEAQLVEEQERGDHRELERDQGRREQKHQRQVPPAEADPRERVPGKTAHDQLRPTTTARRR